MLRIRIKQWCSGLLGSVVVATHAALPPDVMIARFKDDRDAAVSVTFDDALRSHVETALPIFDRYGLHATFFVLISNVYPGGPSSWDAWRRALASGHEIGSHSLTHPDLTQILDVDTLDAEIIKSGELIEENVGQRPTSFAYPLSMHNDFVRNKVLSFYTFDRSDCRVWGGDGFTVADGIKHLEQAVEQNEWFYCMLHGVGENTWGPVDPDILDGLVRYLAEHRDRIWTDTYSRVFSYTRKRNRVEIALRRVKDESFDFRLSMPAGSDAERLPPIPLTVKISLDGRTAEGVTGQVGGETLVFRKSSCGYYLMVDLEPDGRWVSLYWN